MSYCEKLLRLNEIKDRLQDNELNYIFETRINFLIDRDVDKLVNSLYSLSDKYRCPELQDKLLKENVKGIILFGCGKDGMKSRRVLEDCGYTISFFCDSAKEKIGEVIDGIKVISIEDVVENYTEYLVLLSSRKFCDEMKEMLEEKGFPKEMILKPRLGIITGICDWQYFDVLKPCENEVFIDGGCWNGDTIKEFIKYSHQNYKKVLAFEPLKEMYQFIQNRIIEEKWSNIEVINGALWNKNEELKFSENTTASRISNTGERIIQGISIDSIAKDEKVTFIKLDVEGAELEALEGAREVIQRDKPKLAISVYHKNFDIIDLPLLIIDLVSDCRFRLRHYYSEREETVLYVECD